jgi:hypothetical protein
MRLPKTPPGRACSTRIALSGGACSTLTTVADPEEAVVPLGTTLCYGSDRERPLAGCDTLTRRGGAIRSGHPTRAFAFSSGSEKPVTPFVLSTGRCVMLIRLVKGLSHGPFTILFVLL